MISDAQKEQLCELIERFQRNCSDYENPDYDEANLRADFVDKFFTLLGWDVTNTAGHSERHRDVVREYRVKIHEFLKKPDYSFQVGGYPVFFVEAKKPSVSIQDDVDSAFQIRRYGYSAELPLSILTNFKEFAVYNTGIKLHEKDGAKKCRIFYCTFEQFFDKCAFPDYETNFDYIAALFSKDGVLNGNFDRYADSDAIKRGTSPVDEELLAEVEQWRLVLARSVAKQNPELDSDDINFVVQRIVDRILFLRIAEDRQIERYENLLRTTRGPEIYKRLQKIFIDADEKYNAGLFGRDPRLGKLIVDDKTLASIVASLYGAKCPYAFGMIPIEILGSIYERFLGKTIRLTAGHQAKIEEKPEVRKAGGVYYTPQYIVDYIVQETVGRKFDAWFHGSQEKRGVPPTITIHDPACGSGSFLIGAYTYLLRRHLAYYSNENNLKKSLKRKLIYAEKGKANAYRLSIEEKQRILLNGIHGVDIDPIAVEVAKFSLYLKLLENETEETTGELFRPTDLKLLPNLDENILCGNSLIELDYYQNKNMALFDNDEMRKVNAFDWQKAFPMIFEKGGFDCVIGNPPYVQQSMTDYFNTDVAEYLKTKYASSMGRLNTFGFFIAQSFLTLLKSNGTTGIIVPNTILTQEYYQELRKIILANRIDSLTQFSKPVFSQAVVETVILVADACKADDDHRVRIVHYGNKEMKRLSSKTIKQKTFLTTHSNSFLTETTDALLKLKRKIEKQKVSLGQLVNINQAIALKHDRSLSLFRSKKSNKYKPVLDGRHIDRYSLRWNGDYLAYNVENIHSCKRNDIFEAPEKILFRRVGERLTATYDDKRFYALNTLVVMTPKQPDFPTKLLLAIFNSKLLNFYYQRFLKSTKKVFSEIQARQVAQLPMPSFESIPEKIKTRLVNLVDQMLAVQEKFCTLTPKSGGKQTEILDDQIDKLVYELYGLTKQEIAMIEKKKRTK